MKGRRPWGKKCFWMAPTHLIWSLTQFLFPASLLKLQLWLNGDTMFGWFLEQWVTTNWWRSQAEQIVEDIGTQWNCIVTYFTQVSSDKKRRRDTVAKGGQKNDKWNHHKTIIGTGIAMKKLGVRNNNLQMSPQLQHCSFQFPLVSVNVQMWVSINNQPSLMPPLSSICNHMAKKGSEQNPSPEVNCIFAPGLLANLYLYLYLHLY